MNFEAVSNLTAEIQIAAVTVESGELNIEISCSEDDKRMCPISRTVRLTKDTKELLCYVLGCSGCLVVQKVER